MDKEILSHYNSDQGASSYTRKFEKHWSERVNNRHEQHLIRQLIAGIAAETPLRTALDLPCGYGRLMPVLRQHVNQVFEGDWSLPLLKTARESQKAAPGPGEADGYVRATALAMPFADGTFDFVLSVRLCHHIRERTERLAYVRELLRISDHWVVFTYFDAHSVKNLLREVRCKLFGKSPKWTLKASEIREIAETMGFEVAHSIPLSRLFSGHRYVALRKKTPGRAAT